MDRFALRADDTRPQSHYGKGKGPKLKKQKKYSERIVKKCGANVMEKVLKMH